MKFILSKKIKYYVKINSKIIFIIGVSIAIFISLINSKYKLVYSVSINNNVLGYSTDNNVLEDIKKEIQGQTNKNFNNIEIAEKIKFEKKLVQKSKISNNEQLKNKIKDNIQITYKYYDVLLNGKRSIAKVNNIEDASKVIDIAKSEVNDIEKENLNIMIIEKLSENLADIEIKKIEDLEIEIKNTFKEIYIAEKRIKEEQDRKDSLKDISGIKIAVVPVVGNITSR